jgi:hypothetical protein
MSAQFLVYCLQSDALCLGERVKKGTYRTTVTTVPYSQITGALRAHFAGDIHAVGYFVRPDPSNPEDLAAHTETVTFALVDSVRGTAKLPIEVQVLTDVKAQIYVRLNDDTRDLPPLIHLSMGAYRNKGLGACVLDYTMTMDGYEVMKGELLTRIPENRLGLFEVRRVHRHVYGYLFEPDEAHESGCYVRSLFEGSIVEGPSFLVR